MKKSETEVTEHIFVKDLRVNCLTQFALPWFFGRAESGITRDLFVIHRVSSAARMLTALLRTFGVQIRVHELDFDFIDDVRLPGISSPLDHVYFSALPELLGRMECDPQYAPTVRNLARGTAHEQYIHAFISKRIFFELNEELRSVLITAWYSRKRLGPHHSQAVLYLEKSWWFNLVAEYALRWDVQLRPLPERTALRRTLTRRLRPLLRSAYFWMKTFNVERKGLREVRLDGKPPSRIAAEMYSNGIRREPIYNTEFFWYRKPNLPQGAVFGYFALPQDQPTEDRQTSLRDAGIEWIDRATLRRLMHTRNDQGQADTVRRIRAPEPRKSITQWALRAYIKDFYSDYERWHRFFIATGARIHVSTFDIFPSSEALHAALADVGGVSVSIQRSIEREPSILRRTVTDVHFAFSRAQAEMERLSGSCIAQFITAGHPFDDAFPATRAYADQLISQLRSHGVAFTLCFFDENHGVVPKRVGGRRLTQEDYTFLCDRLAADETLGLILKPKRPETLPERLGPVWPRVQQFIDSGRCVFLGGWKPDDHYLPCVGACASDLAISMLSGGTAGLESYLAGTRTLMLRHSADLGAFARLPPGSVVFNTWEELWQAVECFRTNPNDPHIGNWEPIIEEFASLCDGRASERIGNYITWLFEAFAADKSREEALEYAGGRYAATWGAELITKITQSGPWQAGHGHRQSGSAGMAGPSVVAGVRHNAVDMGPTQ